MQPLQWQGKRRNMERVKERASHVRLIHPKTGQNVWIPEQELQVSDSFHFDLLFRDVRALGPQIVQGAHEIWDAFPFVRYLCMANCILVCSHYFILGTMRMAGGGSIFQVEWLAVFTTGFLISVYHNWENMDTIDQRCFQQLQLIFPCQMFSVSARCP